MNVPIVLKARVGLKDMPCLLDEAMEGCALAADRIGIASGGFNRSRSLTPLLLRPYLGQSFLHSQA